MKILYLCKGNVGRSQIAEGLSKKIHPEIEAMSAGTKISRPEQPIGELLPHIQEVLDVMNEEGVDVSMCVRKQLTEVMAQDADKIVAIIEDSEELPEYLINSGKLVRWNIPDPKGKDLVFTQAVKDQIKQFIETM
jgi:arsenate reductase